MEGWSLLSDERSSWLGMGQHVKRWSGVDTGGTLEVCCSASVRNCRRGVQSQARQCLRGSLFAGSHAIRHSDSTIVISSKKQAWDLRTGPINSVQAIKMSDSISDVQRSPLLGEHTEEILRDVLGYSTDQITEIKTSGAITAPEKPRAAAA